MAGLPRSGSSLLSAILNQNPLFYSSPSSPVLPAIQAAKSTLLNNEFFKANPRELNQQKIISGLVDGYYSDIEKPIVIDKNRSWTGSIDIARDMAGSKPKIICTVRDVNAVLASFISMHRRNPFEVGGNVNFIDLMLIKNNMKLNDEKRCEFLSSPMGALGSAHNAMLGAYGSENKDCLHFVEYEDLVSKPKETLRKLYEFIGEECFEHDFENIKSCHKEKDIDTYGIQDMHVVRSVVEKTSSNPEDVIPESIFRLWKDSQFWRDGSA